jgi:GNAT superfamily N-acetyltransferase
MASSIEIRRALVADALAVHGVLLAAKDEIPLTNFDTDKYRQWVRDRCRKKEVWIANMGGALAGVMVLAVNEIYYLATLHAFRKRGVGRALVHHAIERVEHRYRGGVKAKVKDGNAVMLAFLKNEGFSPHPHLIALPGWTVYFVGDVP